MHKLDEACVQPDNVHQSATEKRNYTILKILHIKFKIHLLCSAYLCVFFCFNTGPQQGCGGYMTGSDHTFASPDSDSNGRYDKNLNCVWFITAPVNKVIKLTFHTFALEAATTMRRCIYDYVKVRLLCSLTRVF